ncbi:MAG TPA: rhodanese-like domain-containing protein [Longimicrobium sp.]
MSARVAHRLLAGAAAVLALLAVAAGEPRNRSVDVDRLARIVENEEDHVTALELAGWIRERKPGLRVIDVRGADDFAAYHLPRAENLSLTALTRAGFRPDETVVLYSEGGTHAAQGWFFLRASGVERVYFLRGGLYEWLAEVMNPALPANPTARQQAAFDSAAALARYFGGVPRTGVSAPPADDPYAALPSRAPSGEAAAVRRIRQRGC